MKGDSISGKGGSHDVLLIYYNEKIYLVDGSIWQFFKNKKNILIKQTNDLMTAIIFLKKKYGGRWNLSESLVKGCCRNIESLKKIINKNISVLLQ